MTTFDIISPHDGSRYAEIEYVTGQELADAVKRAKEAEIPWSALSIEERIEMVGKFVSALEDLRGDIAADVSHQMGRPFVQSDEMGRVRQDFEFQAEAAVAGLNRAEIKGSEHVERYVLREPLGLTFSIAPWNYPTAMMGPLAIGPLLSGNVVIFKHAEQTGLHNAHFNKAAEIAGLPQGVLQCLNIEHEDSANLLKSGDVDKLHFIGSTAVGKHLQQTAAAAPNLVKMCLELGGKDAIYVRSDVDLDKIMPDIVGGVYGNAGQSCCSVERIYVDQGIYDQFVAKFRDLTLSMVTAGDSKDPGTFLGPVVSAKAADRIRGHISEALAAGAENILPDDAGTLGNAGSAHLAPSALVNAPSDSRFMMEEVFGPTVGIQSVSSDDEAISLINTTKYGLSTGIWTNDVDRFREMVGQVRSGTVYLNRCDHADDLLPWGGYKMSGIGRISGGALAFSDQTQMKSVHERTLV